MRIFLLALLSCLWINTARADFIPSGRERRRYKPVKDYEGAEVMAAVAAAAAAGIALAKKKKKDKADNSPEECVIDQDGQVEEGEEA